MAPIGGIAALMHIQHHALARARQIAPYTQGVPDLAYGSRRLVPDAPVRQLPTGASPGSRIAQLSTGQLRSTGQRIAKASGRTEASEHVVCNGLILVGHGQRSGREPGREGGQHSTKLRHLVAAYCILVPDSIGRRRCSIMHVSTGMPVRGSSVQKISTRIGSTIGGMLPV
eukprot:3942010-Rhodomonas_salina.1